MSLYEWGLSVPWCITDEALQLMLMLAAREQVDEDELKQAMHGPKSLALRDGRRRDDSASMQTIDGVARITIDGPIYRYASYFTRYSGGITSEALAKDFQKALNDPAVGAIVFIIDSPGGEATGINELADTIYAARGTKPLGAYIEGYGASAAYWIASAADVVAVDESALVGSIGTVAGYPDPAKRASYTIDFVSTQSPKKRVDPSSPEGRAYLQQLVDDLTEVFIAKVMRNRDMSREQVLAIEGGMRIGQQSIDAGLADRLGSEDQLIRELAAKAAQRAPFSLPPGRVPGGNPIRMEGPMEVFSKDWWKNLFVGQAEAGKETGTSPTEPVSARMVQISAEQLAAAVAPAAPAPPAEPTPEQTAQSARIAELEKHLAEQRTQQIAQAAAAFADRAVRERYAFPAEHASLVKQYVSAAQDDDAHPWGPPKEGEAESRVALLEWDVRARPQHSLSAELIASGPGGALENNQGATKPMSEERRRALLAMTPMGQKILAEKQARTA